MQIAKLQHITQETKSFSHLDSAIKALRGGVKWIQLRVKNKEESEIFEIAEELKIICQQFGARLVINDYLNIAKELNLDGVHLGLTDTSTKTAREFLGKEKLIGGSANTLEDIIYHYQNGVNYVGIGPFKYTNTKEKLSPTLGLEGYKSLLSQLQILKIDIPLIAIGGITETDIPEILQTGIFGVAIASVINLDNNPSNKAQTLVRIIENTRC